MSMDHDHSNDDHDHGGDMHGHDENKCPVCGMEKNEDGSKKCNCG